MKDTILSFLQFLALVILISAGVVGIYHAVNNSVDKQEVVECNKLQEQSEQYVSFYVTEWQKDMCVAHGFTFAGSEKAPVLIRDGMQLKKGVWYYKEGKGLWHMN